MYDSSCYSKCNCNLPIQLPPFRLNLQLKYADSHLLHHSFSRYWRHDLPSKRDYGHFRFQPNIHHHAKPWLPSFKCDSRWFCHAHTNNRRFLHLLKCHGQSRHQRLFHCHTSDTTCTCPDTTTSPNARHSSNCSNPSDDDDTNHSCLAV